ncbi:MAG: hydratase, partial [Smithellaceae bacterium]|nr:hydratase [Smithellaceae bacterium]
ILSRAGLSPLATKVIDRDQAKRQTLAARIMADHNQGGDGEYFKLRFDSLASHDITYVGIIQTARASGMTEFPVPYVLTNCHNSLCAVGGTINEDDHLFGLSAARKYGGIYVPAHQAVIHQYMREMMSACGKMILGSDSHTRYGALGSMGIGEGGGELVKQLLGKTYDLPAPEVIAVYLEGTPPPGVGPQDVALALVKAVFHDSFVTNKVLEFVGPGIENLSVDFRNGIDVMTTETTCLSSIWQTDEKVAQYYRTHGRPEAYKQLLPGEVCYYDGMVRVDMARIEPMIALPMHPSNVWPIAELNRQGREILCEVEAEAGKQLENKDLPFRLTDKLVNGRLKVEQGIVVGCAGGTFENILTMARMLAGRGIGDGAFSLSVYPASQPIFLELVRNGAMENLMRAGAIIRTAFCGPCFGAGDTPAHNTISIRHATRNFPNREGSIPAEGQVASVALMDARSIAATAMNGGMLTPATEAEVPEMSTDYFFDSQVYQRRVYQGFGNPQGAKELRFGPNIADWPVILPLTENILLQVASVIHDPITTTDELIPSGQASSYRSNPLKLAEYTLSRKDPLYVERAKSLYQRELKRRELARGGELDEGMLCLCRELFPDEPGTGEAILAFWKNTSLGSVIFARKPGDGSAREQAASCQKVLGGQANIALEYATKRYRGNLINWGMLPFTIDPAGQHMFALEDYIFIPGIVQALSGMLDRIPALVIKPGETIPLTLKLDNLSRDDRDIILAGCLMNYYNSSGP